MPTRDAKIETLTLKKHQLYAFGSTRTADNERVALKSAPIKVPLNRKTRRARAAKKRRA